MPNRYRGVSVAALPASVALDEVSLRAHFLGRDAYRRTRFVVVRAARAGRRRCCTSTRASRHRRCSPRSPRCRCWPGRPTAPTWSSRDADTGIPSELARVALARAPGVRAVAVQGRYAHVNVIVEPRPLRVRVREVVPPEPAKLLDQARRVLAVAEELPPIELVGSLTDLADAGRAPARRGTTCCPCRGSGGRVPGAQVSYLDEHPERADWTLLGLRPLPADPPPLLRRRRADRRLLPEAPPARAGRAAADQVLPAGGARRVRRRLGVGAVGQLAGARPGGAEPARRAGGAGVGTRLSSSTLYAHLWGTAGDWTRCSTNGPCCRRWLDVLAALARAQAALGLIPAASARGDHRRRPGSRRSTWTYVAEQTRETSHSTLGLIRGLLRVLPARRARARLSRRHRAGRHRHLVRTGHARGRPRVVRPRPARGAGIAASSWPARHRDTVMVGRTHGQPGAPITFGFKAASWADEIARHLERLAEGRPRWAVGQLGGAVGALGFFGADGPRAARPVLRRAGAGRPRDLVADRPRPGRRVRHRAGHGVRHAGADRHRGLRAGPPRDRRAGRARCGRRRSARITMPHKRNPEGSEHLDTLARLARSSAAVLVEGMVGGHERDGRSWKAEWIALPEVCQLTGGGAAAGASGWSPGWRCTPRRWRPTSPGSRRPRLGAGAGRADRAARQAPRPAGAARGAARRTVPDPARRRWPPGVSPPRTRCAAWAAGPGPSTAAAAMVDTVLARPPAAAARRHAR